MSFPPLPAARDIEQFGKRHRLGLMLSLAALISGTTLTAVAVAPMVPDASRLPQRLVTQALTPPGLQAQLDALALQQITLTRNEVTRAADTAESLFARLTVHDAGALLFLRRDYTARQLLAGRAGKMVQARVDGDGTLQELVARYPSEQAEQARTHFTRLLLMRGDDGRWRAAQRTLPYSTQLRLASGTVSHTFFAATDAAGMPEAVAAQLADIFSTDIDFHRELRPGDRFSVVYESLLADDEPVIWNEGAGRVLAAEFVNGTRAHHAVWFESAEGRGAYFSLEGRSKRRAFLASPMELSRINSGFAMRFHPLMQQWRQHLGVDYGAPAGTAVRTVADGVVDFAGWKGGYGNVVQVLHGNERSTLYAHLSRMDVRTGQRVRQGQRLGDVGTTGWSTGPHLHFEFRIKGQHQDPLRVAKTTETVPLDSSSRHRFAELVRRVHARLEVAQTLAGQHFPAE